MSNLRSQHIFISCPPLDNLAIYSVDIISQPTSWWSESTNSIKFHLSVINSGESLELTYNTLFSVKQYFSADGILDENTPELALKLPSDHMYDYRAGMAADEIITSPILTGELTLPTKAQCLTAKRTAQEAKTAEESGATGEAILIGKPTVFWKLVPSNPDDSAFLENDILTYQFDASVFECTRENVDLGIFDLEVAGGVSTIYSHQPINYTVTLTQKRSDQGFILASDRSTADLSYKYEFYLANGPDFSDEAVLVDMEFEQHQIDTMQDGINADTAPYISKKSL